MSLQLELLDNNSFSQELDGTFQQDDNISFELRKRTIHNSRRRGSKAISNKKKQIRKSRSHTKHLLVQLRGLKRRIR